MNITNVEVVPVFEGRWNALFVVVDTDEGISGVGESGLTGRELAVMGAIEHFRPLLLGQDANRIEHLWQMLIRGGFFPAGPVVSSAVAAIDIALWDIQAKARGVPLYQLLGGLVRDRVACFPHNGSGSFDTDELVASCRQTVAEGWKFVRFTLPHQDNLVEPGESVRAAIEQVAAVRAALPEEIDICLDVHARLDLPNALRLCREIERFRPFFVEDPLRPENLSGLRALRRQTAVPLAVGEQLCSKWQFRELIEEGLVDFVRVDVCIAGGITEARKIAGWAETHSIKLALHNPPGPVALAACLHLDLACSNFGVQEFRKPVPAFTDVVRLLIEWQDGSLLPPTAPGLGVELDRSAARKHPFHMAELPHVRHRDGSVADW